MVCWKMRLLIQPTAAVCGNIFASPNPGQVGRALELVNNPKGSACLLPMHCC